MIKKTKAAPDYAKMTKPQYEKALKAHLTKLLKENQEQQATLAAVALTLKQRLAEIETVALAKKGIVLIAASRITAGDRGDEIRTRDGKGWTQVRTIVHYGMGSAGKRTFGTADGDERWFGNFDMVQARPHKSWTKK